MSGSHLCIPRNETVQPPCFQNSIMMFCLPIPKYLVANATLLDIYFIYRYSMEVDEQITHECENFGTKTAQVSEKEYVNGFSLQCTLRFRFF